MLGELHVRIVDEFVSDAGVEVFVAFRHLLKTDHLDIDDLGDRQSVDGGKTDVTLKRRHFRVGTHLGHSPVENETLSG